MAGGSTVNTSIALIVFIPFVLFIICGGASLWLARRENERLYERSPGVLSYAWGYFLGYSGVIGTAFVSLTVVGLIIAGLYRAWFPVALVYLVLLGIASYGVLTRRKWGWVFHIPLCLNPGLWAFNCVYLQNRWREFT